MLFTVELVTLSHIRFRLQEDDSWRKLENNFNLQSTDFRTDEPSIVVQKSKGKDVIELEGNIYRINPSLYSRTETDIVYYTSMVFRRTFPSIPDKEQLRQVIAAGDDSKNNSLILNVYGKFELRQRPPYDIHQNDPTVIVRNETFAAHNDYVGPNASKDDSHIDAHYLTSLRHWVNHLYFGQSHKYSGEFTTKTIAEIQAELVSIKYQWSPEY